MNLKIVVATHKPYQMPKDPCYLPVEVGAALRPQHFADYRQDNAGKNISEKNKTFCELTALYWAWKNLNADAVGLVHYRRYFKSGKNFRHKWAGIAKQADYETLLQKVPVILPCKRNYYIETSYSQYVHAHHEQDLTITRQILVEKYPAYLPAYDSWMKKTSGHRFNMFVMRRPEFEQYCEWLFSVLFELEKRLDISAYSEYDKRVFGFVSERLLDCWIETNEIAYKELPVLNMESQHWPKKILRFLRRKFIRNKI